MSTFAASLSQESRRVIPHHIQKNALYCGNAIKHKCLMNKNAKCISGIFSSNNNESNVSIIDGLSYEPSASEMEAKHRKSLLHKPSMESKLHLYQDATGRCFRHPVLTSTPAEVDYFANALKEVILNLGFEHYKITPIALKHIERTTTPASLFVPTKVVDKVVGSPCYMFHIEIRW